MFVRLKNSVRTMFAMLGAVVLGLTIVSCSSSGVGVLASAKCPSEEEVYQFAMDMSNGVIGPGVDRVRTSLSPKSEVVSQFVEFVDPACMENLESMPYLAILPDASSDGKKIVASEIEDIIRSVCRDVHKAESSSYDSSSKYTENHKVLAFMAVVSYLSGGPLYTRIQCFGESGYHIKEESAPIVVNYPQLARSGVESEVLTEYS